MRLSSVFRCLLSNYTSKTYEIKISIRNIIIYPLKIIQSTFNYLDTLTDTLPIHETQDPSHPLSHNITLSQSPTP